MLGALFVCAVGVLCALPAFSLPTNRVDNKFEPRNADAVVVSISWNAVQRISKTTPTLQVVTNPMLAKDSAFASPIHDRAFGLLSELNADFVRFVPWFPFPKRGVAELEPPSPKSLGLCAGPVPQGFNLTLSCGTHGVIKTIEYASYAIPTRQYSGEEAMCAGFAEDPTSKCLPFNNVTRIVESLCIGHSSCTIVVPSDTTTFGDPCPNVLKRLAIVAQCTESFNYSSWDFSVIDPMLDDFLRATQPNNGTRHRSIINYSTQPAWMFPTPVWSYVDSPNLNANGYANSGVSDGSAQSVELLAKYYKRLLSWYTQGGFEDEFGVFHTSGHFYNITMWEVYNEITFEHAHTPATYCAEYDAITAAIREVVPNMEFVGLAMGTHNRFDFYNTFLNSSNHAPNTPLDWISYHMYANCGQDSTDPSQFSTNMFDQGADPFLEEVAKIEAVRVHLAPSVRTTIDEVGTFCGENHPEVYWNAAAAYNAYLYLKLAQMGIDAVGWSQLVAYPALPSLGLEGRDEPVAMLNWTTGEGNARYWSLKILIEHTGPGDKMVQTTASDSEQLLAQAWIRQDSEQQVLVLVNKQYSLLSVQLSDQRSATAYTVDESTGYKPARVSRVQTNVQLQPFAVCVLVFDE